MLVYHKLFSLQVEILGYLLTLNFASVHYKDSLLQRTALHWACIGGHPHTAKLLLQNPHPANVNSVDKYQSTPIISATLSKNLDVVRLLISYGANVLQRDRLRSSALHYACVQDNREMTSTLIKAGCIANDTIVYGRWTPLISLMMKGDEDNCHLLVAAGYDMRNDYAWILQSESKNSAFKKEKIFSFLANEIRNPKSLQTACSHLVRKRLGGIYLQEKLKKLPLPTNIIHSLQFKSV